MRCFAPANGDNRDRTPHRPPTEPSWPLRCLAADPPNRPQPPPPVLASAVQQPRRRLGPPPSPCRRPGSPRNRTCCTKKPPSCVGRLAGGLFYSARSAHSSGRPAPPRRGCRRPCRSTSASGLRERVIHHAERSLTSSVASAAGRALRTIHRPDRGTGRALPLPGRIGWRRDGPGRAAAPGPRRCHAARQ